MRGLLKRCAAVTLLGAILAFVGFAQQEAPGRDSKGGGANAPREGAPVTAAPLDAAAADRGAQLYKPNCGFCHGPDARGALAPDLAGSLFILNDDAKGAKLGDFLRMGRPDKGMPAFAALTVEQVADLSAFLHGVVIDARRQTRMDDNAIVVGDPGAGREYFNGGGKCNMCHSPTGDLKGIATKYSAAILQDHIVNPRVARGGTPPPPPTVSVTLHSGEVASGTLVSITDFYVTLLDGSGARRTFSRDNDIPKVEIHDPLQAHLDMIPKYTDKNMHDLTAYLVSLK